MKKLILAVVLLTSCQNPRYRDGKGVYIYVDSCIKSSSYLHSSFIMIDGIQYPQVYTITTCDSSVTVKTYLGK